MSDVFFTYIWGAGGKRGMPLTFAERKDRTIAVRTTNIGDLVFGIVSRNPADQTVEIPNQLRGRVVKAWQISHQTADTSQFGIEAKKPWERTVSASYRWPYALQALRAWTIIDPPRFSQLFGYNSSTHHLRAITSLQKVNEELAASLKDLLQSSGKEIELIPHCSFAMSAEIAKLKQKHPYGLKPYAVEPNADAMNSVYIATLGRGSRIVKIGHAQDSVKRVTEFNKYRLSKEVQWVLHTDQVIGTVTDAIEVEKRLGDEFASFRTEPNNNEIYLGLDPMRVAASLVTSRR